jgi:hypothetical protein
MIVFGRHRAVTYDTWSEMAVRTAIEEIVTDAVAHFHLDAFWPRCRPWLTRVRHSRLLPQSVATGNKLNEC